MRSVQPEGPYLSCHAYVRVPATTSLYLILSWTATQAVQVAS